MRNSYPATRRSCSSAASTSRSSAPTGPARRRCSRRFSASGRPEAGQIRIGHGVVPAYFSQHDVELPDRGTVLDAAVAATRLTRPQAQSLLGQFLFSGWETHEKQVSGALGRRAPRGSRSRCSSRPAQTCSCSTSRRTTSTSRAGRRSRPRWRPSQALCSSCRTTAPCSTPCPTGSWPSRAPRCVVRGRLGRPGARACRGRGQAGRTAAAEATPRGAAPTAATARTELEKVETQITQLEQQVATLEGVSPPTGPTWTLLAAHRAARDELQAGSHSGRSCSRPRRRRRPPDRRRGRRQSPYDGFGILRRTGDCTR